MTCRRFYAAVLVTVAFFSFSTLIHAMWIPAKAELAQWLIERSWQKVSQGESLAQPWPWADTQAIGVLTVPDLAIRQIILEGNSGRNLAFGPVLLDGFNAGNDLVVSGHRDTHFRFMQNLAMGDTLQIELRDRKQWFEVVQIDIVDTRESELILEPAVSRLSLVTCYPFEAVQARGPLRYVVTALPVDRDLRPQQRLPTSG